MNPATATIDAGRLARDELSRLAAGGAPDGARLETFGEYAPLIRDAYAIHAQAGTPGVLQYLAAAEIAPLVAGDPDTKPRYVIHWAHEALKPQAPLDWIVQDVFAAGSVSLVVGDAGSGKTWLCLDLAVTVATAAQWLGYQVKGGPTLIIDEESGPRRLALRLGQVLRGHEAGPKTPMAYTTLNRFDLWNPSDVQSLAAAIRETDARLVIFDAFMELLPGRDENSVKDVLPGLLALRDIAEATGAGLVVIHHANKGGNYRGSSAIKGAVDLLLTVDTDGAGLLTVKSEKARDVEGVKFAATMNFGLETFNLSPAVVAAARPVFAKGERFVLHYLAEHDAADLIAITGAADICSAGTARNAVYALTNKGLLRRVDAGGRGVVARYALTEQGRTEAGKL